MNIIQFIKDVTRPVREFWLVELLSIGFRILRYHYIYKPLHKSRFDALKQFKGIHKGERVFIIATGPSLRVEDLNKLTNEYTFAMNSVFKLFDKTIWRPTYYGICDNNVFLRIKDEINKYVESPIFINDTGMNLDGANVFPVPVWENWCRTRKMRDFISPKFRKKRFSSDISKVLYEGTSVVHFIMQICFYMGFSEIYLLGTDCTNPNKHADGASYKNSGVLGNTPEEIYAGLMADYDNEKENATKKNIRIYNATRGGALEKFPRVDLDEILHS